jgi:hypothetical protein
MIEIANVVEFIQIFSSMNKGFEKYLSKRRRGRNR